jgi:hypothetical protein
MSASMSNKTFISPDFLTTFSEEYGELPILWQVRSSDYSNRAKRDEVWKLLVQFTREKIPDADLCLVDVMISANNESLLQRIFLNKFQYLIRILLNNKTVLV